MYMDKHLPYILAFADIQKIHVVLDMIIKQLIREVEQVTERLTEKTDEGIWVKESHGENIIKTLYQCYGAEPLPDYSNCDEGYLAMEKLLEHETAEEDGRLVVLPCVVGDILFCFSLGKVYPFKVRCARIYEERTEIELWYSGDEENYKFWHITIAEQDIGYKFFFTEEEAEKALKEMKIK